MRQPRLLVALGLLAAVLTVIVLTLLAVTEEAARESGKPPRGFPDQFQHMHALIRSGEDGGPAYEPGYRVDVLRTARSTGKKGTPLPWIERGPSNVSGRTRTIVVDAADPTNDTWLAGSVGGGIWRTTNGGQSWSPMTEDWPSLAVSTIAQSASSPNILYAGTGEGFGNVDAISGDGIFKSFDGGLSWIQVVSARSNRRLAYINRLIVHPNDPNHVVAATNTGIYQSLDGGSMWTESSFAGVRNGQAPGRVSQVAADPTDFSIQYAAVTGNGMWKSRDAGASWLHSGDGMALEPGGRVEFAISPSMPQRLLAITEVTDGPEELYATDTGAAVWAPVNTTSNRDIAGNQAWYDLAVAAHPYDPDIFFVGGIQMYRVVLSGTANARSVRIDQENTTDFLTFFAFGAEYLGGALRIGLDDDEAILSEDQLVSVEIRFGPGRSQMAHRFTPPDEPGIDFVDYPYAGYVEVPFEVWDIEADRQLHVSFRDRSADGMFNLIPRDFANLGREYIMVHAATYTPETPDPQIARDGGVVHGLMYFLWPMLTDDTAWNPTELPTSTLRFNPVSATAPESYVPNIIGSGVHVDHHALVTVPLNEATASFELLSGNDGGVFFSSNGGGSWVGRSRGYNTSQFYGVDRNPGASIYIGGMQDNGTYRSFEPNPFQPDLIPGWTSANGGDGFDAVWHQQDPNRLLAGSQYNGLVRSVNGGFTWSSATSGLADIGSENPNAPFLNSLERHVSNSNILFAIGGSGIWRSTNFGETWSLSAIPEEQWAFRSTARGTVRPSLADENVIWAGYEMDAIDNGENDKVGQLHVSTNAGVSFRAVPSPEDSPTILSGLATHPSEPGTVYALFSVLRSPKILRSQDWGQTWEDISGFSEGMTDFFSVRGFPDVALYDLLVIPSNPRVLWAATEVGIFTTDDGGLTWAYADNGLPAVAVWRLKLVDDEIVAATHGRGVWTVAVSAVDAAVTGTEAHTDADALRSEATSLEAPFPNPFRQSLTIPLHLKHTQPVRLSVLDLSGREIAVLYEGMKPAGRHRFTWDAEDAASGTYVVRMQTGNRVQSRTVVYIR